MSRSVRGEGRKGEKRRSRNSRMPDIYKTSVSLFTKTNSIMWIQQCIEHPY